MRGCFLRLGQQRARRLLTMPMGAHGAQGEGPDSAPHFPNKTKSTASLATSITTQVPPLEILTSAFVTYLHECVGTKTFPAALLYLQTTGQ